MITLTISNPVDTMTTTAGADYRVGVVGNLGGARVLLESNLESASTEFSKVGEVSGGHFVYSATGTTLRASLLGGTSGTSIKINAAPAL